MYVLPVETRRQVFHFFYEPDEPDEPKYKI